MSLLPDGCYYAAKYKAIAMAIFHRLALAALILVWTSHSPVGAVPPGRAGGGLAAIFSRNAASSSSSSESSKTPGGIGGCRRFPQEGQTDRETFDPLDRLVNTFE